MTDSAPNLPQIAILGAGPVGLEAALAAHDAGLSFVVLEAADRPAAHVRGWGHVRLFTPWSLSVSPRMRRHLEGAGHDVPGSGDECPTGAELVARILEPVAALPAVAPHLRTGSRVRAVGREGLLKSDEIGTGGRAGRPFRLLVEDPDGRRRVERARAVLDCTGTWGHPNALGAGGIPAPGEEQVEDRILRRIPSLADRAGLTGKRVLLVGAGHSAQTAARDLAADAAVQGGPRVVWAVRDREPDAGAVPGDSLPLRAELTRRAGEILAGGAEGVEVLSGAEVTALEPAGDGVAVILATPRGPRREEVDRVVSLTGSVGDASLYRQLQVHECYATSGPMSLAAALLGAGGGDCLAQPETGPEVLTNPEPDFFILGSKSYGRNATFLLRVGWEQVDQAVGLLLDPASTPLRATGSA